MSVAWFDSKDFDAHAPSLHHPESPERLHAIREAITRHGLDAKLDRQEAPPITKEILEQQHAPTYLRQLQDLCQRGGGHLDPDTPVVEASWNAALKGAGAVRAGIEGIMDARWKRVFCSVRPPGHHARPSGGMGFCLLDNVAIGADIALSYEGIDRVAILDWDVHHGNGTQEFFWKRPDVFFASMHQYPFYPGTGSLQERGAGAGVGTTLNCPLPMGSGDRDFLNAWEQSIRPAFDKFEPDILLISAGFDADARDPIGGLAVSASGFQKLSESVVGWANHATGGKILSVLEGGYNLDALGEDVSLHLMTLLA